MRIFAFYVQVGKDLVKIFLKLQPQYASSVLSDGSLIVESVQGLYQLMESSFNWYHHCSTFLEELGFKKCKGDPCLFQKNSVPIALFVDDLLITGKEVPGAIGRLQKEGRKNLQLPWNVIQY